MPPYTGENEEEWETRLAEEVCEANVRLWNEAGRPPHVFIGVDGVVPFAKIKQQRMRRFKSIWWAAREYEAGVRKRGEARWDSNAITPGTLFMERLGARLTTMCKHRGWTLSTSDEPGEGEHKVMDWIRTRADTITEEPGSVVIYGLDADLILLSLLTSSTVGFDVQKNPSYLMREKAEFTGEGSPTEFLFLSVDALGGHLASGSPGIERMNFLKDYISVMSLLGNDFLPHGISFKIKDGAHEELLRQLHAFHGEGGRIVDPYDKIDWAGLRAFMRRFAFDDGEELLAAIRRKQKMRPMKPRNDTERAMSSIQSLPLQWMCERMFLDGDGGLVADWKGVYHGLTPPRAVGEYLYGLQWVLDYYLGYPVNRSWYFPWHLPPLWSDILNEEEGFAVSTRATPLNKPLEPQEQLAMVLPIESWHLVRDRRLRQLPVLLPQMFPFGFGFQSLGRYWMWECEADVPLITPGRLRSVVAR